MVILKFGINFFGIICLVIKTIFLKNLFSIIFVTITLLVHFPLLYSSNFDSKTRVFVLRLNIVSIILMLVIFLFELHVQLFIIVCLGGPILKFLVICHLEGLDFHSGLLVRADTVDHNFVFLDIIH